MWNILELALGSNSYPVIDGTGINGLCQVGANFYPIKFRPCKVFSISLIFAKHNKFFYIDDLWLFFKAIPESGGKIFEIIDAFGHLFVLKVNKT